MISLLESYGISMKDYNEIYIHTYVELWRSCKLFAILFTFSIFYKNLTFACTWTCARSHKFDETAEKS